MAVFLQSCSGADEDDDDDDDGGDEDGPGSSFQVSWSNLTFNILCCYAPIEE